MANSAGVPELDCWISMAGTGQVFICK